MSKTKRTDKRDAEKALRDGSFIGREGDFSPDEY
jgi:hypothetical protein